MIRKITLGIILLALVSPCLVAGDIATFLNLGFSDDSQYFMFGQYGITDGAAGSPWADGFIIDMARNSFATKGTFSEKFDTRVEAGNTAVGAMLKLVSKNSAAIASFKVNHLRTGRIVYVLIDGQKPLSSLEFRDFSTGALYSITLTQKQKGSGTTVSAAFAIGLTATDKAGKKTSSTIDSTDYYRAGVKEYRIKYIILSPDGKSLVFVMEKSSANGDGEDIRYMVEAKKIN